MGSKNYLKVDINPRSTLSENKQKSCESYDSTCSNYSQFSENSDPFVPNVIVDSNLKSSSAVSNPETFTHFDFSSNEAQIKRTVWQKAVASFRSYKDKKTRFIRAKSTASPCRSPKCMESQEIDPVYHLLKCAASQKKFDKNCNEEKSMKHEENLFERSKSIPGVHLDVYKGGCSDPTCPCNQPEKLPVVKREDLGQQAKREQSIKKYRSPSPRQPSMHSRSSSVSMTYANP